MVDLNVPSAKLLLARLDVSIDEQTLVIQRKELRMAEMRDEIQNVQADIVQQERALAEVDAALAQERDRDALSARTLLVTKSERSIAIKNKKVRLLELDEEHAGILGDIEASRAHITKLKAEVAQQTNRLNTEEAH